MGRGLVGSSLPLFLPKSLLKKHMVLVMLGVLGEVGAEEVVAVGAVVVEVVVFGVLLVVVVFDSRSVEDNCQDEVRNNRKKGRGTG